MPVYTSKDLKIQDKTAESNTYFKAPKATPSIEKIDEFSVLVRSDEHSIVIKKLEECILMIIADFKFCPVWLIKNWVDEVGFVDGQADEIIEGFINTGLCWTECTSTGVYLRPTIFLLDWFQEGDKVYKEIPFNLLTHSLSEEQVMFDIIYGNKNNELYYLLKRDNTLLPGFSPIGIKNITKEGTICIRENEFRIGMKGLDEEKLISQESEIMKQIQNKEEFTNEFEDLSQFLVVYKIDGKLGTQCPDLAIPIKRDEGKPKSWAIEVELTPKGYSHYVNILKAYKNNLKYGTLVYLCAPGRTTKLLRRAYEEIGGSLGYTKMIILEFEPPALSADYFLNDNLKKQRELSKSEKKDKEEREEQISNIANLFDEVSDVSDIEIID